jgi:hypothetical protein
MIFETLTKKNQFSKVEKKHKKYLKIGTKNRVIISIV